MTNGRNSSKPEPDVAGAVCAKALLINITLPPVKI
uniref:Uncharacterized protein n=1 Tax=Candidatus Nitrotoga fabula TaxID=2182327 RepID=A0A2X0REQ5_9PROT|nr:protein of unknown function [Candidatus Nitrotoga fabula]